MKCPLNHFFPTGEPRQRGLRCRLCRSLEHIPGGSTPACSTVTNNRLPSPRTSCGFCLAGGWGVLSPPGRAEGNMVW